MKRIALVAVGLLAVAALAGLLGPAGVHAAADEPDTRADTVTVGGTGSARAVPDRAQVTAGVETRAATAQAALSAASTAMNRVIAALRGAGAADLATSTVSLSPYTDQNGAQQGFVAANQVTASFPLARAGEAVDAAVRAGANTVYGPTLTSSSRDALYREALEAAFDDAKARAGVLAAAAGRGLGEVLSMSESGGPVVPMFDRAAAAPEATPIVSGEQETTASVGVTFELR